MFAFERRCVASLIAFLSLTAALSAASITGRVRDSSTNSYILGASVTVRELGRTTTTAAGGEFNFANIPAGAYTLEVSSLGFDTYTRSITVTEAAAAPLDVAIKSDVLEMGKFVVEGTREGQARALQQKRSANNILDAISADAVGKFPDGNAAEALRRVPGVSVEIDQDEGRYVVLRGIDSNLNTVTLNNQLIGTPSEQGNRGIALDSVPADLISRLEVVKAVTPDMDASAIGGSVNIVTQSAFDRPEGFFFGSVGGFYDNFGGRTAPNGSFSFGRTLGADRKWGVVLGASYSRKEFKSQTVSTDGWSDTAAGFLTPSEQQSYDYDVERKRLGVNFALQFRPAAGHDLALRVNHNEFTDNEGRQSVLYEFRLGAATNLTNETAAGGSNATGRASRQFRDYHQTGTIDALSLEGKHQVSGGGQLSWQLGTSKGERDVPTRVDWEFRSSTSAALANTFDRRGEVVVIKPNTDAYYNPATFPFRRVRIRSDLEKEDVVSGQIDYRRDIQLANRAGFWKVGAKAVTRDKRDDRNNNNYNAASPAFTLADSGLAMPEVSDYFEGLFRFGPRLNLEGNKAYFAANPNRFTKDAASSLTDSMASDFDGSEDVIAAYAMLSVDLNPEMTLMGGLRYEGTDSSYGANERRPDRTYHWVTGGRSYDNFLPGLHFNWRPNKQWVLRAAWTNTISRPNYAELAPRRTVDAIADGGGSNTFTGSISTGNPELKPYEAMNFDVSLEYYLSNSGIASIGAFHKSIDNPVYSRQVFQTNVTVDGTNYSKLTTTGPQNADSGRISGIELNYQQFFKFLPSPFDGFGVNFNYTLTDSSATLFTRATKLPFFKQSDRIANVALFFEKYGLEARVALSYSSDYLDEVGGDAESDIYLHSRTPIDAKISYRINPTFKVFAEFLNLSEEPLVQYIGTRNRDYDHEIYEWKARFGVNFTF